MEISNKTIYLDVIDYTISKETFQLLRDSTLDLLITSPQPDESKLSKYYESDDYISHTDGKRTIFEKVYQIVKNVSLKNKIRLINSMQQTKGKLLDIGAGTGDFLLNAISDGWDGTGIEPSDKARIIAGKKGVIFKNNTSEIPNDYFDIITMWHVLEHVPDPEMQIAELKRLIKPTGTIIVAVPNFNSYDAQFYQKYWAAYDVPRHLWHYSKTAISKLFAQQDLIVEKVIPMKFDAFYVALLSEKYKTGKMNPLKAFYIGLKSNLKGNSSGEFSSHIYVIKAGKTLN